MDKQLRIIAAEMIVESKLSKSAKFQLLNFIKEEATDAQIKALLMDGKIVQLDEQAEEIVNDRFEISEAGGKVSQARKTYFSAVNSPAGQIATGATAAGAAAGMGMSAAPALASAAVGAGIWALYRVIRGKYDKCTKRCGTFEINTARRQHCMAKCKVEKTQAELTAAMKSKNQKEIEKKKATLAKAKQTFANIEKTFRDKEKPR